MTKAETLERVLVSSSPIFEIVSPIDGPFDESVKALPSGFDLWLPKHVATARMSTGPRHSYSTKGSWFAVGYSYNNRRPADILIAKRPYMTILQNPKEATEAHRKGRDFYIPAEKWTQLTDLAKKHPEDAIKSGVLLVSRKNVKPKIPTNRLGDYKVTRFLFEDQAERYGQWLAEQGIREMLQIVEKVDYAKKQKQPFERPLRIGGLLSGSELSGYFRGLYDIDGRVRGVRELLPAEAGACWKI